MPIRARVSAILEMPIREGRWVTYTDALDREGKFSRKTMLSIIMALCEEVEQLELKSEPQQSRPELDITKLDLPSRPRDAKGHFIKPE